MRTILSSGARPSIGPPPIISPGSTISTSRSTISQLKRKVNTCDASTTSLAPVRTDARAVDITRRDRRRQQWNQKIAQLQLEIAELREREARAWHRIQSSSINTSILQQRRCYSTAIAPAESNSLNADTSRVDFGPREISGHDLANLRSYENCLAEKVGLQLLLHLSTGVQPTARLNYDIPDRDIIVPDSVESLLKRLSMVQRKLHQLKASLSALPAKCNVESPERKELDEQISKLTWRCRTGEMSTTELAMRYTQAVMRSKVGLSLSAYQNLVETFSTLDQDILITIAMSPYLNTHQILGDRHIGNMIQQYGKVKDPARLERFLRRLVKPEGFEIASAWEFVTVNGVRVPSPVNRSTALLDILTRSALQGDQPHKAQAWAQLLIQQQNASAHRLAAIFNNFLTYCAKHLNWIDGNLWLHRTVTWIALIAKDAPWTFQKLIHRMLDLCLSCGQTRQYNQILDAAVVAGIDIPKLDETRPDALSDQARKIRNDWISRLDSSQPVMREKSEFVQAATKFQVELAKMNSAIQSFIGVTNKQMLQALASSEEISHSRKSFQPIESATNDFQPWEKTYHLNTPEGILISKPIIMTSSGEQTLDDVDFQALPTQSDMPQNDKDKLKAPMRTATDQKLSKLQEAYDKLTVEFEQQRETIDQLRNVSATQSSDSYETEQIQQELQDLMKQLFATQNQNAKLQSRNSYLQDKHDDIQGQMDKLELLLAESKESERELTALTKRLQSQLETPLPKSLEAVFLEKENMNIRFEMRTLSARYLAALGEKENMQRELQALRLQLEKMGKEKPAELISLQREIDYLREQLAISEKRFDNSTQPFSVRKLHTKANGSLSAGIHEVSNTIPGVQEDQDESQLSNPIQRFSLRSRRANNDRGTDSLRSPFSMSST